MATNIVMDSSGRPIFIGTSVSVSDVMAQIASGATLDSIVQRHPGITLAGVVEALQLAAQALAQTAPQVLAPASSSPAAASVPSSVRGLTATLTLVYTGKVSYAVNERVAFRELLKNDTDAAVRYSYLGVKVTNAADGSSRFHTSWSGPDLKVDPRSEGPSKGGWEDSVEIDAPGNYVLTLEICFGSMAEARNGIGWERLTPGLNVAIGGATPISGPGPAATPAPPAATGAGTGQPGPYNARGIVGNDFWVENTTVGVNENIWFNFKVTNPGDAPIRYGVLAAHTDVGPTAQSWTNSELGPKQVLEWRDHLNIATPGTYRVYLGVCFNPREQCLGGGAPWERLSADVTVTVR